MRDGLSKGLAGGSVTLLLVTSIWYVLGASGRKGQVAEVFGSVLVDRPYRTIRPVETARAGRQWREPARQSWDEKAIFEVFTPPIVYYSRETNTFTLEPPLHSEETENEFGVELVGFARRPYRLQFEGYVGEEGDYMVLLKEREMERGLRGRVNDHFSEEEFTILSFVINRNLIHPEEAGRTPYVVEDIELGVFDIREGRIYTLGKEPTYYPGVEAILRSTRAGSRNFQLREGAVMEVGDIILALRKIDLVNQNVTLEKRGAQSDETDTRTLLLNQ